MVVGGFLRGRHDAGCSAPIADRIVGLVPGTSRSSNGTPPAFKRTWLTDILDAGEKREGPSKTVGMAHTFESAGWAVNSLNTVKGT